MANNNLKHSRQLKTSQLRTSKNCLSKKILTVNELRGSPKTFYFNPFDIKNGGMNRMKNRLEKL